ncbi:MAG: sulfurtransferase [Chromatiaceae bacterium]|nr:sulfurtransferase [Chromatiaceae bacterium]
MAPRDLAARCEDARLRIFDCRFSLADTEAGRRAHAERHLPGALYAHLDEDLSAPIRPDSGRHPLPEAGRFRQWLGSCGVSAESEVVVYDDCGGAFAGRLWWLLRHWMGHPRVALLDGGLNAWVAAGGALSERASRPEPCRFEARPRDAAWIGTEELVAARDAGQVRIIDARPPERFRGDEEPLDPVAGHIPGAVNLPLGGNLDADGRFLDAGQLGARFAPVIEGFGPEQVVHSCGSGVTACHNLLAMEQAGLGRARLYVGSWSEWIRSGEHPVARGAD